MPQRKNMFKFRLLQENNISDRVKAFANSNPGISMGLGGAALGALTGELTHADDRWTGDAQQDLKDYEDTLPTKMAPNQGEDQAQFEKYVKHYTDANDLDTTTGSPKGFGGQWSDMWSKVGLGNSDAEDHNAMRTMGKMGNNNFGYNNTETGENNEGIVKYDVKNSGLEQNPDHTYKIDPRLSPEDNYKLYNQQVTSGQLTKEDALKLAEKDPSARHQLDNLKGDIKDSGRNALISYGLGGAALGAGANFARRKMNK